MINNNEVFNKTLKQIEFDLSKIEDSHFNEHQGTQPDILNILTQNLENNLSLSKEQTLRIEQEFTDYGPLCSLFKNKDITEIIVNGSQNIYYELKGELLKHNDTFLTDRTFRNFILKLTSENNINFNLKTPSACFNWDTFRIQLLRPPIVSQISICFRRSKEEYFSLEKLLSINWCNNQQLSVLKKIIKDKNNILIAGSTGSGKTTLVNAILSGLAKNERVVTIEDVSELKAFNNVSTQLYTRTSEHDLKDFNLSDLVKESLRMRPDRIVLGEVRGEEAKDLILALATGHKGSIGTIHADSAKQALLRLEMLVQLGAPQWSIETIRKLIHFSIEYVIILDSADKKQRKLQGVYKMTSLESCGFLIQQVC